MTTIALYYLMTNVYQLTFFICFLYGLKKVAQVKDISASWNENNHQNFVFGC